MRCAASPRKALLQRHFVHPVRTLDTLLPRLYFQLVDKMCNVLSTALLSTLMGLGLVRVHPAAVNPTDATRHPRLVHELTDNRALAGGVLGEGHILRKAEVVQDRTAFDLRWVAGR